MQCSSFHDIFLTTIPFHPIRLHSRKLQSVSIGIIIVLISRRLSPLLTKRSLCVPRPSIWRYYHAFRTFSTASTPTISRSCLLEPLILKYLPISFTLLTTQYSNPSQSNFGALTPKPLFKAFVFISPDSNLLPMPPGMYPLSLRPVKCIM